MSQHPSITKIYGGPGTGKTTKFMDLLEDELKSGVPIEKIAYISHTVAARDEARVRAMKAQPDIAKDGFKYFRTIHGICYQEIGLGRTNVMQPDNFVEFGRSIGLQFSKSYSTDVDEDGEPVGYNLSMGNDMMAVRQYAAAWGKSVSEVPEAWPLMVDRKTMKDFVLAYKGWKEQEALFDYVDMLEIYSGPHCDPLPIDVMFIDEAQDLSPQQWAIVKKMWGKSKRVYIAGDDDQSIYTFLGADPHGFLYQESDHEIVLPITWRCRTKIWEEGQRIITMVNERKHKDIKVNNPGGTIEVWNRGIHALPFEREKTMLVMTRHQHQLNIVASAMRKLGIPFNHKGRALLGSSRALSIYAFLQMRAGSAIPAKAAGDIARRAGEKGAAKHFRSVARDRPDETVDMAAFMSEIKATNVEDWIQWMATSKAAIKSNEQIRDVAIDRGLESITSAPNIDLVTYHGSKGREADHVMLFTDMFYKAWRNQQTDIDTERRIAYVGVTRARERLTVIAPKTSMYMETLI